MAPMCPDRHLPLGRKACTCPACRCWLFPVDHRQIQMMAETETTRELSSMSRFAHLLMPIGEIRDRYPQLSLHLLRACGCSRPGS